MRFLFYILLFIVLYRFITRFVLPVFQVTRMTNDHLRKMKDQMQEMEQRMNQPPQPSKEKRQVDGEYIDYEEVK